MYFRTIPVALNVEAPAARLDHDEGCCPDRMATLGLGGIGGGRPDEHRDGRRHTL